MAVRLVHTELDRQHHPGYGDEVTFESRVLLNRAELKLLDALLVVRNWWFEHVTCRLGRLNCRLFRHHNVTCRGRSDHHVLGEGLIDRDRWNGWPRR